MQQNVIHNIDCVEGLKLLPDNSMDLTVTSPPYDNIRTYNGFSWDFEAVAKELFRVTKRGGVVVWIVGDATIKGCETGTSFKQALFFKEIGFNLHDTMIWQKISPFQHKNRYVPCFEYMFVFSKGKPKTTNIICDRKNKHCGRKSHGTERQRNGELRHRSDKQMERRVKEYGARFNVWDVPAEKNNKTGHPAVFPIHIARDHILTWSNAGDIVLDPFMGSGTTAAACMETGRSYIGFEISKEYCDIARKRLEAAVFQMRIGE